MVGELLEGVIVFVGWVLLTLGALLPVAALVLLILLVMFGEVPWWLPLVHVVGGAVIGFFTLAGAGDSLIEQGLVTLLLLVLGLSSLGSASTILAKLEIAPDLVMVCMIVILGLALTPAVFFFPAQLSDLKRRSG